MFKKLFSRDKQENFVVAVYDEGEEIVIPEHMQNSRFYSIYGRNNYKVALDRGCVLYTRIKYPNSDEIDARIRKGQSLYSVVKSSVVGETILVRDKQLAYSISKKYGLFIESRKDIASLDAELCKEHDIPIYMKELLKLGNGDKRLIKVKVEYSDAEIEDMHVREDAEQKLDKRAKREEKKEIKRLLKEEKKSVKRR